MAYLKQEEVKKNDKRVTKPKKSKAEDWRSHYDTPEELEASLKDKSDDANTKSQFHGPAKYGRFYWCVKTEESEDGEIYVFADEDQFTPSGAALFVAKEKERGDSVNLALAPGRWTAIYGASCLDGSAVSVEHWKGEVQR